MSPPPVALPQASDPVVIEDPVNVISNVGRSSYHFARAQGLFAATHDALERRLHSKADEGGAPEGPSEPAHGGGLRGALLDWCV